MNPCARIDDPAFLGQHAKQMARDMVLREWHGPDDKLDAIAHRIERKWRVPASVVIQGWKKPARDWKVSRWMSLFQAHCRMLATEANAKAAYEEKRHEAGMVAVHPALVRLADFVAGRGLEETADAGDSAPHG